MKLQSKFVFYDQQNLKYCTLFISGTELRTAGQTDQQTDGQMIRLLYAPGGPLRPGGIKSCVYGLVGQNILIVFKISWT